jgi:predicted PurR-regulated permease PerM
MERRYIESLFFLTLLVGTLVVVFFMFQPFLNTLILAAVLAFLFSSIYERLATHLKNRSLAAALMTLVVLLLVLLPLTLAGLQIAHEASGLYASLRDNASTEDINAFSATLQGVVDRYLPGTVVDPARITERLQGFLGWLVANVGVVFASFGYLVLNFFFLLLFFFYLVRDGYRLKRRVMDLSPLSDEREEQVIERVSHSISATVRGSVVLAVLQGLVSTLGFLIFGVPNPALWGSFVVLAAFIPTIGTALIQIPAIIYLAATGHFSAAIGLTIWAVTAVGLLDNVLGPVLMSHGVRQHPLVVMLAVLGGISLFGPIGILLGPIIVALLYALLDIYLTLLKK